MPKRSLAHSDMPLIERVPPVKAQKTERSHEENQERAYIAASRRADRSLEARVQSAKMASEIHRRRTGRGLKVTEEIVIKEEMYEEEDDDLPRQYKYLTAHLQTNSQTMNHRFNAYATSQVAMAAIARYNEVNRLFQESFPSAAAYQQQLNHSTYISPLLNNGHGLFPPLSPTQPTSPETHPAHSPVSQIGNTSRRHSVANSLTPTATSVSSPPPMSPSGTASSESRSTPFSTTQTFPVPDPKVKPRCHSVFTSELPNEVKLMYPNIDMQDPLAAHFFSGNPSMFQMNGFCPDDFRLKGAANSGGLCVQVPEQVDEDDFTPQDALDLRDPSDDFIHSPTDTDFTAFASLDGLDSPNLAESGWDFESFVDLGTNEQTTEQ